MRSRKGMDCRIARKTIKLEYRRRTNSRVMFLALSMALIIVIVGISASIGSYSIGFTKVYQTIWHGLLHTRPGNESIVVWNLRLPRIAAGFFAGLGLGAAGAVMQSILRNPLASPFTLGVSAGASFGAALAILFGAGITEGRYLIIGNAFLFSLAPTLLIMTMTFYKKATPETMILTGGAVMYLFSAATTIMMYVSSSDALKEAFFWMVGSLGKVSKVTIIPMALMVCGALVPIMYKSNDLNTIAAGDESARSLGIEVGKLRIVMMIASAMIAAAIVAFTGPIGFVGLAAPHMCRMIIGADNRFLIPASGLTGALLLLVSDIIARMVMEPVILPVGVVTDFLGAPLFIYLILRRKKEYW